MINVREGYPRPRYIISESQVLRLIQTCPEQKISIENFAQMYLQFSLHELDKTSKDIVFAIFEQLHDKKFIEKTGNIFQITEKGQKAKDAKES